jgi:hypothetical protein
MTNNDNNTNADNGNIINLANWKQGKSASAALITSSEAPTTAGLPLSCKDALLIRAHRMRCDNKVMFAGLRPKGGLDAIVASVTSKQLVPATEQMTLAVAAILIARTDEHEIKAIVSAIVASGGGMLELVQASVSAIGAELAAHEAVLAPRNGSTQSPSN